MAMSLLSRFTTEIASCLVVTLLYKRIFGFVLLELLVLFVSSLVSLINKLPKYLDFLAVVEEEAVVVAAALI